MSGPRQTALVARQRQDGNDLVEEAYEDVLPVVAQEPLSERFKPWHKPRKQYVRVYQWCHEFDWIQRHIVRTFSAERPLKLLTLPGEDFLDIRQLHNHCQQQNSRFSYVGFLADRSKQASLSRNDTLEFDTLVSEQSQVLMSRFEDIRYDKAAIYKSLRTHGPFDLVNLDFCDALGSTNSGETLDAIRKLLTLQRETGAATWAMCLTWRVDEGVFAGYQAKTVTDDLQRNLNQERFRRHWNADYFGNSHSTFETNWTGLSDWHRVRVASLAVGKWLLCIAVHLGWRVEIASCLCYSVGSSRRSMASVVYRFLGVDLDQRQKAPTDYEVDCAIRLHNTLTTMDDLDDLLLTKKGIVDEMIAQSMELLGTARYRTEGYEDWAWEKMGELWESDDEQ